MAQQKHFTLEEVIPGGKNYKKLQPQNMHLQWHGNKLVRIEKNTCAFYNGKGQWEQLFSLEEITSACKHIKSLDYASFPEKDIPVVCFHTDSIYIEYNWKNKEVLTQKKFRGRQHRDVSAVSKWMAYNLNDNLYVENLFQGFLLPVSCFLSVDISQSTQVIR